MKIIFDLRKVGLGNNGGSSTLIKSGNTLVDLGHDVTFIDGGRNQHTWTPLRAKHVICKKNENIPNADFIIATGYKSVGPAVSAPDRCGQKLHWIRGWETWQMPENRIIETVLKAPTIKLVNGICLQRKLQSHGFESKIVRPGYDLVDLYPMIPREDRQRITLGGLYSHKKHMKIKRTQWIFDVYTEMQKKYNNIELWMFGNDVIPGGLVSNYWQRPSMEQKNYFYNNVDVWLSPATQEGLHMPPAEAMMTGCPVVGTNADMSGTEDYLFNEYNGLVSGNTFSSFSTNVERLVSNETLRLEMGQSAINTIKTLGDRFKNMRMLIEYLKGLQNDL